MIRAWLQCFVKNGKFADCRGDGNGKTVWLSNSLGMSQSRRSHRLPKAHLVLSNTNQSNDARLGTAVLSRGKILPPFAASFGRQFMVLGKAALRMWHARSAFAGDFSPLLFIHRSKATI
jgi:hypothetical protein